MTDLDIKKLATARYLIGQVSDSTTGGLAGVKLAYIFNRLSPTQFAGIDDSNNVVPVDFGSDSAGHTAENGDDG